MMALASVGADEGINGERYAQVTIRQRIIIRIPALAAQLPPAQKRIRWREDRGPKCIAMNSFVAAAITRPDAVDLMLRGGRRARAQLEDECPAIDFYSGFYILPTDDGRICAERDSIRSRAGGQCGIERFRTLTPGK